MTAREKDNQWCNENKAGGELDNMVGRRIITVQ